MKLKELMKNAWFNLVITTVFERIPFLKKVFAFVDGKKTTIGRILMAITAVLAFVVSPDGLCSYMADYCAAHPDLVSHSLKAMAGIGWLITELGLQHKTAKELSDEGVVTEGDL